MKRRVGEYRSQFYTILEKIVNSKLKGCEEFYNDLICICLELLHPTETKISIEALHLLKTALEIVSEIKSQGILSSNEEESNVK